MKPLTWRRLVDRKIVEYLVAGKSRRWIKRHLKIGSGRFEKVSALAQQHGYLDAEPLPAYPQAPFPDRPDRRAEARSDVDVLPREHQAWIEERLKTAHPRLDGLTSREMGPDQAPFPAIDRRKRSSSRSITCCAPRSIWCESRARWQAAR